MPIDEKVLKDFDRYHDMVDKLAEWVDRIYYDPGFATFSNKPKISYIITACDFIRENLKLLKAEYIIRKKE